MLSMSSAGPRDAERQPRGATNHRSDCRRSVGVGCSITDGPIRLAPRMADGAQLKRARRWRASTAGVRVLVYIVLSVVWVGLLSVLRSAHSQSSRLSSDKARAAPIRRSPFCPVSRRKLMQVHVGPRLLPWPHPASCLCAALRASTLRLVPPSAGQVRQFSQQGGWGSCDTLGRTTPLRLGVHYLVLVHRC